MEDGEGYPDALVLAVVQLGGGWGGERQNSLPKGNDELGDLFEEEDAVGGGGVEGQALRLVQNKLRKELQEGGGDLHRPKQTIQLRTL